MRKGIILTVFLCLSLGVALLAYLRLDTAANRATLYLEQEISRSKAKDILIQENEQAEKIQAVFWGKNTRTNIDAEVFVICGDARLLIQGMETLNEEDNEGCLISTALATELFKSTNVKGNHINLEETYIVRGVFQSTDKQLIRLSKDDKDVFTQVHVHKKENEIAGSTLYKFTMRHGLMGTTLQWIEYIGIVKGMLLLAVGLLAMLPCCLIRKILPQNMKLSTKIECLKEVKISPKIVIVGYIGIVLFLLGKQIQMPIEMIPAKWSDFGYWNMWFRDVGRNVGYVFLLEKTGYEKGFLIDGIWSIIGSMSVIFGSLGILFGYVKRK